MKNKIALTLVLASVLLLSSTLTVSGGGPCDGVQNTPYFTHYYGYTGFLRKDDIVEAINPRGDRCGCFIVHTDGLWGYMRVYGEDGLGTPGMRQEEVVIIKVNGVKMATSPFPVIWENDWDLHKVDLLGPYFYLFLPIIQNR